jgi:NTE family protein
MSDSDPNVAIACQGGGSHTAFTAGVLDVLLDEEELDVDVVGFSGTSGGAICALLAWYGMVHDDHEPGELLLDFWAEISASSPVDYTANASTQWMTQLRGMGMYVPEISPYYSPGSRLGQEHLRRLLETCVDFETIPELLAEDDDHPGLFISAVEVLTNEFELFREDDMSADAILASAAEPSAFNAVEIDGRYYWDGLFAKNPPIQDFSVAEDVPDPDEVWVIKINPTERDHVPKSLNGIMDRRNELAGNVALKTDVRFIEQVNRWIESGYLPDRYTHTTVERIRLSLDLDWGTKSDRDPQFLQRLIRDGRDQARAFLDGR